MIGDGTLLWSENGLKADDYEQVRAVNQNTVILSIKRLSDNNNYQTRLLRRKRPILLLNWEEGALWRPRCRVLVRRSLRTAVACRVTPVECSTPACP